MALLDHISYTEKATQHRPWPRIVVADAGWNAAIDLLATGRCTLLGLWGDGASVQMALLGENADILVVSYFCKDGTYPSVGVRHPPAIGLERAIGSLFGLEAAGLPTATLARSWVLGCCASTR